MLTISITFAVLVALWGFSATLVSYAKRGLQRARTKTAQPRPAATRAGASRTRPVTSA